MEKKMETTRMEHQLEMQNEIISGLFGHIQENGKEHGNTLEGLCRDYMDPFLHSLRAT